MTMEQEPTREELVRAAVKLGRMMATGQGDFYDIVEGLASGYAIGIGGADVTPERAVALSIGALNELQSVANSVIAWRVDDARELHMPWSEIGDVLEMTKQAAQQRFGKKP